MARMTDLTTDEARELLELYRVATTFRGTLTARLEHVKMLAGKLFIPLFAATRRKGPEDRGRYLDKLMQLVRKKLSEKLVTWATSNKLIKVNDEVIHLEKPFTVAKISPETITLRSKTDNGRSVSTLANRFWEEMLQRAAA